jgi:hypothetical protein
MDTYAEYKAEGRETLWGIQLMRDVTRVTKTGEAGDRVNVRILDGGKRILSSNTDEKR